MDPPARIIAVPAKKAFKSDIYRGACYREQPSKRQALKPSAHRQLATHAEKKHMTCGFVSTARGRSGNHWRRTVHTREEKHSRDREYAGIRAQRKKRVIRTCRDDKFPAFASRCLYRSNKNGGPETSICGSRYTRTSHKNVAKCKIHHGDPNKKQQKKKRKTLTSAMAKHINLAEVLNVFKH